MRRAAATREAELTAARVRLAAAALLIGLAATGGAAPAVAQPVFDLRQNLDFDRPESWAMKYVASINLYTGLGTPRTAEPGEVELAFEGSWVPSLSDAEATVGFNGTKKEEINRTSVFGRLRLRIGLPAKLALDLSYLPPLGDLDGVEPNLFAVGLERPVAELPRLRVGMRVTAQTGTLEGDITCPAAEAAAGPDPVLNPFLCEQPSNDEMTLRSGSFETSAALLGRGRWEPYIAVAAHYLDLELAIRARYSGIIDRSFEATHGWTWSTSLGLAYRLSDRLGLAAELFYTPLEVVRPPSTTAQTDELLHARMLLRYRLRG